MDKIFCVSEIIFSINDPRQLIADELRYMKTRLYGTRYSVEYNNSLKWTDHVDMIVKKAAKRL